MKRGTKKTFAFSHHIIPKISIQFLPHKVTGIWKAPKAHLYLGRRKGCKAVPVTGSEGP
jgi:hypothetical protein